MNINEPMERRLNGRRTIDPRDSEFHPTVAFPAVQAARQAPPLHTIQSDIATRRQRLRWAWAAFAAGLTVGAGVVWFAPELAVLVVIP